MMLSTRHAITKATVRGFLEAALASAQNHVDRPPIEWSLQGFGMLRAYLPDGCRLHVWDERYVTPGVSGIHTHPWDFESYVVAGQLVQHRFTREHWFPAGSVPFDEYRLRCGPGGGLCGAPTRALLRRCPRELYAEGQIYRQTADEIHESRPTTGTVTVVHRTFRADTEHASVFVPAGQKWGTAEPRPATREEVIDIVKNSLSSVWWTL